MNGPYLRMLPPSASPLRPADIAAGVRAWMTGQGAESLRREVKRRFGARHVFFTTSGRAGLSASLRAMRTLCPQRDEVLLPAFTSFSVPSAVVNAGLKVGLYDLHPWTLAPDMVSLEKALNRKTLCVVACHLFGYPLDLRPLRELCRAHGAVLLDDAAQAMGARVGAELAGTMGDVGLFSLSRGKNITAVDGGIILTDREDLADAFGAMPALFAAVGRIRTARNLALALALMVMLHPRAYWLPASLPFLGIGRSVFDPDFSLEGLDAFRIGMARSVFDRLDALNEGRRSTAASLRETLREAPGVRVIQAADGTYPVYLRLPVLPVSGAWPGDFASRAKALGVIRSYPLALHHIPKLARYITSAGEYPTAEMLAENLLTLPTHGHVRDNDIKAIVRIFGELPLEKCAGFKEVAA
ncbi:dTDP-4-amino-4,6-dideoxygalactose transaminase [Desulfomicrobium apsheronum]|uniref:dTDP-4-amino-4,6-dideoxygalactose transaminase n=1 Tax=Desulfomicrobium apsheronum TaxID=52560 RepID=A0A1I3PTZ2_9BACT|nr:DegT/DnrJ/EryC1/StrS family aminotransferase [Desulfomicrobium apsheronum]SFJ24842.1 dTDP-4-amino-4,6-dideoxygalactose transaminase [Desulfomicrobium apsheronum]